MANLVHSDVLHNLNERQLDPANSSLQSPRDSDSQGNVQPPSSPPIHSTNISSKSPIPNLFQIHPKLLINPHALESSYFTRPNRYFGPESTWRSWTEADRAAYTSLERSKAENLSAHLYNAYALKRKNYRARVGTAKGGLAEEKEQTPFEPPKVWTSWPLPPNEVPREELSRGWEGGSIDLSRRTSDARASTELTDCLIAITQRYARQRWDSREWEQHNTEGMSDSVRKISKKKDEEKPNNDVDVSMQDDYERETRASSQDTSSTSTPSQPSTPPPPGVEYFSSQAFTRTSPSASSSESELEPSDNFYRPVFTADEDRTRQLLIPSTRHLISIFDDLLQAMHKSRQAYAYGRGPQSRSRSQSRISLRDESTSGKEEPLQEENTAKGKSRKRRRETSIHLSSSPRKPRLEKKPSQDLNPRSRSPLQSTPRSKSAALQPHDWSSVIGMASILGGFTPQTIERASERCARLFEENMLFRTFHEIAPAEDQDALILRSIEDHSDRPPFDEHFAYEDDNTINNDKEDDSFEDATSKRIRTSAACTSCHSRKLKCEPATTSDPNPTDNRTISCKSCIHAATPCSGIEYESQAPEGGFRRQFFCPHTYCERRTIAFQRESDLKRHLTLSHGGETQPSSPRTPNLTRSGSSLSARSVDLEMYYCPAGGCSRAEGKGRPFKAGSKLYQHIRMKHPNTDVEEVKRTELRKRGERRGRWTDERRHRSRSQATRSRSTGNVDTNGMDD